MKTLPKLYVEGPDDIGVINGLLFRHGIDTKKGEEYLHIKSQGSDDKLLSCIQDATRIATEYPVGFVIDIDTEAHQRWNAVRDQLVKAGVGSVPDRCPPDGFIGKIPDYPHLCGAWLMPDCSTSYLKLEDLCRTLIPEGDLLWESTRARVQEVKRIVDECNVSLEESRRYKRFRDVDTIKAEVHSWLSIQFNPGIPLGGAIVARIFGHDSEQAIAFLKWLGRLYGFTQLGSASPAPAA